MRKTRVGVVGMGKIGISHLDALRRLPQVEIVAVADRTMEGAQRAADLFSVPHAYSDVHALIEQVDVVHNCTPNAVHDSVNMAAIDAGRHLYAEKPMSDTAAGAYAIYERAKKAGIVHALNHQYRMHAAVQEMSVRIARGDMGRAFFVHGHYHQQSGLRASDYGWRMAEGGLSCALSDIGTHWADMARCVLGQDIVRVLCCTQTIHPTRTKQDGNTVSIHTEDVAAVIVMFSDGTMGNVTVSKVSAGHMNDFTLSIDGQNMSFAFAQENPDHLRIGYKGRPNENLQISPQTIDPALLSLTPLPGGHPTGWADSQLYALREFYGAVRGEIDPQAMRCATFQDGVHGMAFVEACMQSAKTGTWQDVVLPHR